ncbi:hypothetical protein ACBV55_05655 [Franconibacter pulveris]
MANVDSTTSARPEFTHPAFQDIFPPEFGEIPVEVLLSRPLHGGLDFLALAPACAELVAELLETRSTTARLALAGRLMLAVGLLKAATQGELTEQQRDALTVDAHPGEAATDHEPVFESESDTLADYCHLLAVVLLSRTLAPQQEKTIAGLLFELVNFLRDSLTAPRFFRSPDGLRCIDDGSLFSQGDGHEHSAA